MPVHPSFVPRPARFLITFVAVGVFSAVLYTHFKEANVLPQVFNTETLSNMLTQHIPNGTEVQLGDHTGQVIGDDDWVCKGKSCKVLTLKANAETDVRLLVNGEVVSETWTFKANSDGIRIIRPDGSFVLSVKKQKAAKS
jgi:hypothetical protein